MTSVPLSSGDSQLSSFPLRKRYCHLSPFFPPRYSYIEAWVSGSPFFFFKSAKGIAQAFPSAFSPPPAKEKWLTLFVLRISKFMSPSPPLAINLRRRKGIICFLSCLPPPFFWIEKRNGCLSLPRMPSYLLPKGKGRVGFFFLCPSFPFVAEDRPVRPLFSFPPGKSSIGDKKPLEHSFPAPGDFASFPPARD